VRLLRNIGKPRTIAGLPNTATQKTPLSITAARYMVASFLELHHSSTAAFLPTRLLRGLQEFFCCSVFWALTAPMPLAVAVRADFRATFPALGVFAACVFVVLEWRCEPLATAFARAINAILGGELLILLVPCSLKAIVEQAIDVPQRDVRGRTAFGRHVLRVGCRKFKDPLQTFVAHGMVAC